MDKDKIEDKDNYEESYVAFLDILGFKEKIKNEKFNDVFGIYKSIIKDNDEYQIPKMIIMSDSIVVAAPCEEEGSLENVIKKCNDIQIKLLELPSPVLLRGAISKGEFYYDDNQSGNALLFGKGLVDAYIAQEIYSVNPRIIVSNEVINYYYENVKQSSKIEPKDLYLKIDENDEYNYINTYENFFLSNLTKEEKKIEDINEKYNYYNYLFIKSDMYRKLEKLINDNLMSYNDISIRKKYLWLKKEIEKIRWIYLNFFDVYKDDYSIVDE